MGTSTELDDLRLMGKGVDLMVTIGLCAFAAWIFSITCFVFKNEQQKRIEYNMVLYQGDLLKTPPVVLKKDGKEIKFILKDEEGSLNVYTSEVLKTKFYETSNKEHVKFKCQLFSPRVEKCKPYDVSIYLNKENLEKIL